MKYKDTIKSLSENAFYDFVFNHYEPSIYEEDELEDERFYKGTYYSHVCRTRCFLVYKEISNRLSVGSRIVDFGFFPGTIKLQ